MILGLTGGIASGKTQATNFFKDLGVFVVDADEISRNISAPGTSAYAAICKKFAQFCLDGILDRKALREEIAKNPVAKKWLEELLHPQITTKIKLDLANPSGAYKILSSPLLLELPNLKKITDRILLIDIPESLQIMRATQRDNVSKAEIEAIMKIQMPRAQKLALADDIIDNSGNLTKLKHLVKSKHLHYLKSFKKN